MINPNSPAHPTHGWSSVPEVIERMKKQEGLTKREWFAGLAMQGTIAGSQGLDITAQQFAEITVKLADALIAELNKENKS